MTQIRDNQREWISFDDAVEERTWLFDVTFLESSWKCIYGEGCQGIEEHPDINAQRGCCSHGAYFGDDDDRRRVTDAIEHLTSEHWQLMDAEGGDPIYRDEDGAWRTRVLDGACIFLNRPGFPGGAGCALHTSALASNRAPLELKPDVCWQVPIRREDHETESGHLFTMIREWSRADWGDGGHDFGWWCTEATEAFGASEPVYVALRDELIALCGSTPVYESLVEVLDERASTSARSTHPVAVNVRLGSSTALR